MLSSSFCQQKLQYTTNAWEVIGSKSKAKSNYYNQSLLKDSDDFPVTYLGRYELIINTLVTISGGELKEAYLERGISPVF